ncbi:MAG: hypothetical protein CSB47_07385 [Proteobacteria bacterium]|nr:MAG: hypothetical protein CSB47_07385 [Pseudomonadota bacterium]
MGIPVWIPRDMAVPDFTENDQTAVIEDNSQQVSSLSAVVELLSDEVTKESVEPATGTASHPTDTVAHSKGFQAANELIQGLQQGRVMPPNVSAKIAEIAASLDDETVSETPAPIAPPQDFDTLGWEELEQAMTARIAGDDRQPLVFGRGNRQAKWMIVGDIPRLEDVWAKQVFTGKSGELLAAMLLSLGLDGSDVYMTNLLKYRPPVDRSPEPDQARSCLPYLQREAELLKPEIIVLMGRDTAQQILASSEPMARLRQQPHQCPGFAAPIIVTYHPAYLLRQPRLKALVWQDLQLAKRVVS